MAAEPKTAKSRETRGRILREAAQLFSVKGYAATTVDDVMAIPDPREQLRGLLEAYRRYAVDRTFEGGCFFVNLAIEMDDQHEPFRAQLDERFQQFRALVVSIVQMGKAAGAFRADMPEEAIATLVVGYLTGTMMLSKSARSFALFDDANRVLADLLSTFEIH